MCGSPIKAMFQRISCYYITMNSEGLSEGAPETADSPEAIDAEEERTYVV